MGLIPSSVIKTNIFSDGNFLVYVHGIDYSEPCACPHCLALDFDDKFDHKTSSVLKGDIYEASNNRYITETCNED